MESSGAHQTVLRAEAVELLQPAARRILVDCTIGLGGHAEALLQAAGQEALLIGMDLDERNLLLAKKRLAPVAGRLRLFQANFAEVDAVLEEAGCGKADAILADLGVASNQLDDPARGLSFQADGPLDMRLNPAEGRTAEDLVNTLPQAELADLIYQYGEERYSRRIARAIVAARKTERIGRTGRLAEIVRAAYPAPARRGRVGVDPATRTFQALRIAVNDELGSLDRLLAKLPDILAPGGRAGVISFHSLEDRRVKQAFADLRQRGAAAVLTRKPVTPGEREIADNPRSRSAKLRGIEMAA